VVGSLTTRISGGVLPIDDNGDPGVLLRDTAPEVMNVKADMSRRRAQLFSFSTISTISRHAARFGHQKSVGVDREGGRSLKDAL
jgi:hypothetical protein